MQLSSDLIAYLKDWYRWATNGAPEGKPYCRSYGLCGNLQYFTIGMRFDKYQWCTGKWNLRIELETLFNEEPYPFGKLNYRTARYFEIQHLDPKRLAWVKERLIEANVSI
jgi:hypothetical protein